MKKLTALLLSAVLCVGLLAGCGGDNNANSNPSSNPSDNNTPTSQQPAQNTELSGTVITLGSTSMEKVMNTLAEQFNLDNKGVTVSVEGGGSGAGVEAASNGTADIGLASRALKDTEKANGLQETILALDGIAIIVNAENPVADLTVEQIAKIFTGEIKNWSELGGADLEIACMGREAGSGTRDGFESITGTTDACVLQQELTSTGAVIEAVRGNAQAIGYASLSSAEGQDGIKLLTVGGTVCSEETVLNGSYEIQRPFVLVTKEGAALSDAAQAFFDWATSAAAADLIRGAGAVPVV
ncbi:MAG: phosphate ABC transporter substrate-binding protein [Oscillospiraceae bacterium]